MKKVTMYDEKGCEVATAEHEDVDVAKCDVIRNYYVYEDHELSWDELWDRIECGGYYTFEISELI